MSKERVELVYSALSESESNRRDAEEEMFELREGSRVCRRREEGR